MGGAESLNFATPARFLRNPRTVKNARGLLKKRALAAKFTISVPPTESCLIGVSNIFKNTTLGFIKTLFIAASALRQQKLPAWQPILTATTVIPTVFVIGAIFLPIGVFLFIASDAVSEFTVEYTNCLSPCQLQINLPNAFDGDVFLYYNLENYYQNHRRYVKSRNDQQYLGDLTVN